MVEFAELKNNLKCKSCSSEKITRAFMHISSTVEKSMDKVIEDIKQDVKHIVKKIKNGDAKTIKTIYGNE
jgi:cytochrome c-type biogenesis protein CcmH/NrfF